MAKIPFTVSARTAKLIGLENFANAEGAIVELVKNSYDADAKNCIVVFENHAKYSESPSIYIIDNGVGMSDKIIMNHWMNIGTDDKLQNYLSDNGRIKTGSKGIGRFALNRLGSETKVFTVSKKTDQGYVWKVNWKDFDKADATITDVKAELIEYSELNLANKIENKFSNFVPIRDLLIKHKLRTGTVIKISNLNDKWNEFSIKKLFDNLEMLIPPQEQPGFSISLFTTSNPDAYGLVDSAYYDDYDYKLEAKYLGDSDRTLSVNIIRNELDMTLLENRYKEVFDFNTMKEYPYRLEDLKSRELKIETSLNLIKGFTTNVSNSLIESIGKFDFTFYFLKNTISDSRGEGDVKRYPYKHFISANRKAWLRKFGGIKIFRDDFRVRPYGENGDDWLMLGERQAQSPGGAGQRLGGFRIRPNQISGTVNISRIHNVSFQDKSGREGIQENEVFDLFKNILLEIISAFEKDRNVIMYNLAVLARKRNQDVKDKREAKEEAERIKREQEEKDIEDDSNSNESESTSEEKLAKGFGILEDELEEKEEEIRLLRNLASVGLIISSFAHEVKSLRSRLIPRTTFLQKELRKYIDDNALKNVIKDDNPFYMLQLIKDEDLKLKHWLDYSLSSLKRDKRKRSNLNFGEYFETFKSTWSKAVEQRNINIELIGTTDPFNIIRAFEVDMDSIFNNLLSNSLNSLKKINSKNKVIQISWKISDDFIEILFCDNGIGLSSEYQENPDDIFNSFETSKRDRKGNIIGTGLGLYIVKTIIEEHNNASIEIIETDNGFKLKLLFPIRRL